MLADTSCQLLSFVPVEKVSESLSEATRAAVSCVWGCNKGRREKVKRLKTTTILTYCFEEL